MADWITTDEASQMSGYSIQYLQRLLREEKISSTKKGGAYWVDLDSLKTYMEFSAKSHDQRFGSRKKNKTGS